MQPSQPQPTASLGPIPAKTVTPLKSSLLWSFMIGSITTALGFFLLVPVAMIVAVSIGLYAFVGLLAAAGGGTDQLNSGLADGIVTFLQGYFTLANCLWFLLVSAIAGVLLGVVTLITRKIKKSYGFYSAPMQAFISLAIVFVGGQVLGFIIAILT